MTTEKLELRKIKKNICKIAEQYGFQDARVSDTATDKYMPAYKEWIAKGYHGDMYFLEENQKLREFPEKLHPDTTRIISLRYDYLSDKANFLLPLKDPNLANISRYALGRDYHKIMRKKLQRIASDIETMISQSFQLNYRVFVDSAPVLETLFAEKSGLGWKGKHSLIINKDAGSWFFLGEIFINLPLEVDEQVEDLCGSCTACINLCPTNAIIKGKQIDATRCISYLTIENKGAIPENLRDLMGNRIYGCDDCQLACPWNRYSNLSNDPSFNPKHNLQNISLLELFQWNENDFLKNFEGSPIRRIGFEKWQRNLAVALGNSEADDQKIAVLKSKIGNISEMVDQHILWALEKLNSKDKRSISDKQKKLINCVTNMLPRDA
ncbi:MAG: tRNA epoxyqueuosine(34) reductase QueG [Gammaproteobacteria bacterium]|nr:tRNA epoxyqueuosine(34) reductase QueG [Gammaproteobacteria bacterium]